MARFSSLLNRFISWLKRPRNRLLKVSGIVLATIITLYLLNQVINYILLLNDPRSQSFVQWATGDRFSRQDLVTVQRETCPGAPFILPTDGFIGLLYEDPRSPYSSRNPHQGIDIFSNADPGITPVYAAYDGFVTREDNWVSSLIIRIPKDPLDPERTIWLYYTHMADREGNDFIEAVFKPGTRELFVEQGTLLGYTGDYNGHSARSVWVHLHFSIVKDDGNGRYLNELAFSNTLDPTPYLGLPVNYHLAAAEMVCQEH
ncbi:MAG: M23 family metallopeptidase [Chloroflexota bacterium]